MQQDQGAKEKSTVISVACVAVSIATIVISIAVAVILAVTMTYSLRAADEFAESYSQNSISAALNKVNDFVTIPVDTFTMMKTGCNFGLLPKIINATNDDTRRMMYVTYLSHFQLMLFGAEFQLLYVAAGLADRSWIQCSVRNKLTYEHTCSFSNPPNNSYSFSSTYNASGLVSSRITTSSFDPRARPWYVNAPKGRGDQAIFSNVYIDATFAVPVVDVNGPLYSPDGTFLGITSITLDLRQVALFLSNMPRTENGFSALMDADGFMLGASDRGALSQTSKYNATLNGPLPAGCEQKTINGTISKLCRLTPTTYSSPILRELAKTEPGVFANDKASFTRKIKLNGDQWMVSKAPIAAKTDVLQVTINWQIVSLMPVSDVTGPIITGRNAGIAVAVVMIVVSCVACGVALYVLLHPLSVLSEMMEQAAELKDDSLGATTDKSSMREIRLIQDSFERLSAQLKKAKSFLPASLLAQLESAGEEEEEEAVQAGMTSCGTTTQDGQTVVSSNNNQRKMKGADTYSQATARTNHSTSLAAKKVISSNISLSHRGVTVAMLNLRNFHRNTMEHSSGLEASYGKLVDEYQRIAKDHRGIMDSFHGDRFTFTFNSVRPCSAHAAMAATAMLRIVSTMDHYAHGSTSVLASKVTCGVATGRCLVGNLGSDKAKRFTVIGAAFSHATVLERLCKRYPNTSILLSADTVKDSETQVGVLYLDVIDGPGNKAVPIAAAKYVKDSKHRAASMGEWMYEMDAQNSTCDYHAGNSAFLCALNGDTTGAQRHLETFKDASDESEYARGRISELIKGRRVASLGLYYDRCVLEAGTKAVWEAKSDE
eukprot:GILI01003595.1.p1 GENE.GILI01003595.1~~GILI01003595.1.p1  ORF type:complete len:829 (+),score=226.05 GILI01003595.1:114-2600(+)